MQTDRRHTLDRLREKIADLPDSPGVYLFKDAAGRVLYVGKAKSLRSRVGSYFQPSADLLASRGPEIQRMIDELVADIDILECDSEVDALLHENRLIKDIHPRFNVRLRDGKSFPYLQIRTGEDFPRVEITRAPLARGVRLYGPFVSPADLRAALPLMQRVFRFRTCKLEIEEADDRRRFFRPCILYAIKQCTGPCGARVGRDEYREDIRNLQRFLESKGQTVAREFRRDMEAASAERDYERAARLRDQLRALEGLQKRGLVREHIQPEVFYVDPAEGLERLGKLLEMEEAPRTIEGVDIAHLAGGETAGAGVCFIDGRPFKQAYRRYRIRTADPGDDYAAIAEVVRRRYEQAGMAEALFPDVILIDGGPGQLAAARAAFDDLLDAPPVLLGLAKREEVIHVHGRDEPLRLGRNNPALRILQSVRDEAHRFAQLYHHTLRRKKMKE
jgi:excinuclease ABC subunit C